MIGQVLWVGKGSCLPEGCHFHGRVWLQGQVRSPDLHAVSLHPAVLGAHWLGPLSSYSGLAQVYGSAGRKLTGGKGETMEHSWK